jgi:hypothetical protein
MKKTAFYLLLLSVSECSSSVGIISSWVSAESRKYKE